MVGLPNTALGEHYHNFVTLGFPLASAVFRQQTSAYTDLLLNRLRSKIECPQSMGGR